jgi:hypothetical protein
VAYEIRYAKSAQKQFIDVQRMDAKKHGKVVKCLRKIAEDPRQPGLNSHKYDSMIGPNGEEVWESYVENNSPSAWRTFWCYGPNEREDNDPTGAVVQIITVVAITPHP